MSVERLDHYSVRTSDVVASIHFYANLLGFVCGPRPSFPFPGAWLYRSNSTGQPLDHSVVHLIGVDSTQADGLNDFLGARTDLPEAQDTGQLDHIAFRASGIAEMYRLMAENDVPFRERRVAGLMLHLIFIRDPSGVTIELNYTSAADIAAADHHSMSA